jgi:signal peptidase I
MLKKLYNFSNSWTGTIIIVLLIIFFIAQAFVIPSGSMKRTLLIGDHLFVKKFAYGIPTPTIPWLNIKVLPDFNSNGHLVEGDRPKRGDIVVFLYPKDNKTHFVKRCVGVGGDLIMLKNKTLYLLPHEGEEYVKNNFSPSQIEKIGDKLWVKNIYRDRFPALVNDEKVDNKYLYPTALFDFAPIRVKKDHFFMMGDNRDHSNDSRFWGQVPYRNIIGKPWFIYFSWDENYEIRWNRVGKFIDDIEVNREYIDLNISLGSGRS